MQDQGAEKDPDRLVVAWFERAVVALGDGGHLGARTCDHPVLDFGVDTDVGPGAESEADVDDRDPLPRRRVAWRPRVRGCACGAARKRSDEGVDARDPVNVVEDAAWRALSAASDGGS